MDYPECEKMGRVKEKSHAIGEFLEWLKAEKDVCLMVWETRENNDDYPALLQTSTENLLAEYFGIDLKKVEEEKRQMLKNLHG